MALGLRLISSDQDGSESAHGNGTSSEHRSSIDLNIEALAQVLVAAITEVVAKGKDSLASVESGDVNLLSIFALLRHENASTDFSTFAKSVFNLLFGHWFTGLSTDFSSVVDFVA